MAIQMNADIYDREDLIETIKDEYYDTDTVVITNDGYFWRVNGTTQLPAEDPRIKYNGLVSELKIESIK